MRAKRLVAAISTVASVFVAFPVVATARPIAAQLAPSAAAALSTWLQKGANIRSTSPTDFAGANFAGSLWRLRQTGANAVKLVVDINQSSFTSSDLHRGPQTPTDASLATGIDLARANGLSVAVAVHAEAPPDPATGDPWRAHINPQGTARVAWFAAYERFLVLYAKLGAKHGMSMLSIGTEMLYLTGPQDTASWVNIIAAIRRAAPAVKVGYEAQWNETPTSSASDSIAFYNKLDYIGIGAYVPIQDAGRSFDAARANALWGAWNANRIQKISARFHKPIIFTEAGYSSAPNSLVDPWSYRGTSTPADEVEQANGYESFLSYWASQPGVTGAYLWEWSSTPTAGGPGDSNFTPQDKLAEAVMRRWWAPPPNLGVWWPTAQARIDGVQTFTAALAGWPTDAFYATYAVDGGGPQPMYSVTGEPAHREAIVDTSRLMPGSHSIRIVTSDGIGHVLAASTTPVIVVATNPAPPVITVSSPTASATLPRGEVTFSAGIQSLASSTYSLSWQVDGGLPNAMTAPTPGSSSFTAIVDTTGFTWRGAGPYWVRFVAYNAAGDPLAMTASIPVSVG